MRIIIASFIDIATQTIYNWLMHVSTMINSPAALNLQDTVTKNIRILMAAYGTKQEEFAADLGVAQSGLSRKLNRRTDWTMSDIANAACFFNISVADLVLPITFSTGLRPDYQVQHNVAPDNAESRELAGATGPRYIVRPDDAENTKKRGANNSPRAIAMPYDPDFLVPSVGLEPTTFAYPAELRAIPCQESLLTQFTLLYILFAVSLRVLPAR